MVEGAKSGIEEILAPRMLKTTRAVVTECISRSKLLQCQHDFILKSELH
jgi:hypothetical protein